MRPSPFSAMFRVDLINSAKWEKRSVQLICVAASTATFCLIYLLTSFASTAIPIYHNLHRKEKVFWNLAVVRGSFGFFAMAVGFWAIFLDTELAHDVVFAKTPFSNFAMCITVGFFVFECFMVCWSDLYFRQFNLLLNLHHWLSLVGYSLVLYSGSTHYMGCRGLLLEMSTPFSCLCWTLLKAGMTHTLLWKANQFLLVHTFHTRSIVECYIWYLTYQHWNRIWAAMPTETFIPLYVQLTLVTFVMTPYWTYKKTTQMINPVDWNFEDSVKNTFKNGQLKHE
ncbi:protein CLN8-like [Mya arenaria]|uniref:protein CLN8-like n=1 Tax=Mya arenaria TaxID=6604 RepID=UPI0022E0B42A|nr:protein CLN8-like [Mya arenaria]